ncbi:MAG: rhodanese-like domain-containing protein [Planctomycetota bacterium]|nr:rhodanese-like domain-containing protein [Planctomycetota bacterium]
MNLLMTRRILALAIGTALAVAGCVSTDENKVDNVRLSPTKAREWLAKNPDSYLLVDARLPESFARERIPGAVRLDTRDFDENDPDPKFKAYDAIIVYGENPSFGRANVLTKRFLAAGLDVYLIDGGLKAWRDAGLPIEQPK